MKIHGIAFSRLFHLSRQLIASTWIAKSMEQPWKHWRDPGSSESEGFAGGSRGNSGYAAGCRCSLGSLIPRRNHAVGMRQTGALQEEIKGSRAGASIYKPRIRWIRWARASSYSLGRRTVNRYKWVSALILLTFYPLPFLLTIAVNYGTGVILDIVYWPGSVPPII